MVTNATDVLLCNTNNLVVLGSRSELGLGFFSTIGGNKMGHVFTSFGIKKTLLAYVLIFTLRENDLVYLFMICNMWFNAIFSKCSCYLICVFDIFFSFCFK